ncbi:MAG: hypothetical protein LAN64_09100 [Acidobacteriia bacterium]|nr:hypothetical protein [Terriglobia bacterium]
MSSDVRLENRDFTAPPTFARLQQRALLVGAVLALAALAGLVAQPRQAMHSYLLAFMLCLGPTLGAMALLMVCHLTGGDWGVGIRRILEAAMGTLPMLAAAFIPIVLGAYLHLNYPWANPEELKRSEHLMHQASQYLNPNLFLARGVLYFIAWGVMAYFLLTWSAAQDRPPERPPDKRFQALSAVGIIIYGWTLTFAVIDWVMSLTPEFTSTIYGLIFMVGQGLIALCLATIVGHRLRSCGPMSEVLTTRSFHDYGKLILTFVMLWAYFSFSQWLIVWSGNLPEEIHWFQDRIKGDWGAMGLALIVGHFAIPFALLLSRGLKQNSRKLMWIAVWLILMRYLDLYWNIKPSFDTAKLHYSWLDAVLPLAMSALWLGYFLWNLRRRPLVALHDPHLAALLAKQHE